MKYYCYWTYAIDGELFDSECLTRKEALNDAQEAYEEECRQEGIDYAFCSVSLVKFSYDYETGARIIHETSPAFLEYEKTKTDREEHGVWN